MPWKKGESGNPKGKPVGSNSEITRWRAKLGDHLPTVVNALIEQCREGDVAVMRLVLSRVLPPLKAEELPVGIDGFSGNRIELVAAVAEAIAQGKLDTSPRGKTYCLVSPLRVR